MSTHNSKKDKLNDADIAALFNSDAQHPDRQSPPVELDALILNSASTTQQADKSLPGEETRRQKYGPVIATAAVILIGIGLTPLNDSTPNLAPDQSSAANSVAMSPEEDSASISAISRDALASDAQNDSDATGVELEESSSDASDFVENRPDSEQNLLEQASTASENTDRAERSSQRMVVADSAAVLEPGTAPEPDAAPEPGTAPEPDTAPKPTSSPESDTRTEPDAEPEPGTAPEPTSVTDLEVTPNAFSTAAESSATITSSVSTKNILPKKLAEKSAADTAQSSLSTTSRQLSANKDADESASNNTTQSKRAVPANYRESPLLWVIEIKHLFNENKIASARNELGAFREKYPNNVNERLLPPALRTLNPDQ